MRFAWEFSIFKTHILRIILYIIMLFCKWNFLVHWAFIFQDDECWQNNMYKTCRNDGVILSVLHVNEIRNISLVLINTKCDRCNFYAYILFTHVLFLVYSLISFMNIFYFILWIYYAYISHIFRCDIISYFHQNLENFVEFEWSQSRSKQT